MENGRIYNLIAGTYLSPKVHHLVCGVGSQSSVTETGPILSKDGLIIWESLNSLLFTDYDGTWQEETDFSRHVARLAPHAQAVHVMFMEKHSVHGRLTFQTFSKWTSDKEVLSACFECLSVPDSSPGCVETCLLLMTTVLERSLGNVFLTKDPCCPSMVKDLLVTKELVDIFGETAMFCLRILMGPPTSLNLRNLLWHGFVRPGEIPQRYASFLLVMVASLGEVLEDKGIDPGKVCSSRTFLDISSQGEILQSQLPDISADEMVPLAVDSRVIPPGLRVMWTNALEYFKAERYSWCAVLALPLLESILREIFTEANQCPERILTAESTTLFTTFDEILSNSMPNGSENRLRSVIGDTILEMLLDLLVYTDGPRLRDRLSHGELDFHTLPPSAVTSIIFVIIAVSAKLEESGQLEEDIVHNKLESSINSYQSVFHPISVLRGDLIKLCDALDSWSTLPRPDDDDDDTCGGMSQVDTSREQSGMMETVTGVVQRMFGTDNHPTSSVETIARFVAHETDTGDFTSLCKDAPFQTLFRPRVELHLVTILQQIVDQCVKVDANIQTLSEVRYNQWEARNLRSRQRINYQRFLERYCECLLPLSSLANLIAVYASPMCLLTLGSQEADTLMTLPRFLKKVLKFCENLNSMTEKNKWDESRELVLKFLTLAEGFLIKLHGVDSASSISESLTKTTLSSD